ncbi:G2E3 ligase, partial [Todus mexicanus]|nr:G2E3 ligase [Todus mexicanus]
CYICKRTGATITCGEMDCNRSFHLPCAAEGACVTQYHPPFSAFCSQHSPVQVVEAAPDKEDTCLICFDEIDAAKSFRTLVCPMCKHAWFHRSCIQGQALREGISGFRCPLCRDKDNFRGEMTRLGIRIPFRLPSFDPQAHAELSARHRRCDASQCLCPGGREQAEGEGLWQLLLCSSCAAEGTHRGCSQLEATAVSWECSSC